MNKTILTVDDSASMRQLVSLTLKKAGYIVVEAVDGQDGLAKLSQVKTDLVITDLNMPQMDGIEMIRQIRANRAGSEHTFVPIILLTTESQANKKKEGKQAGATGWITKPFKPEQLVSVAKKVLG